MAAQALEQSALEGKDKDQLLQIAKALGVKGVSKLKKADLIGAIIDATGGGETPAAPAASANGSGAPSPTVEPETSSADAPDEPAERATAEPTVVLGPDGQPLADWEIELAAQGVSTDTTDASSAADGRRRRTHVGEP